MKIEYINPFIQSANDTFITMLGIEPAMLQPQIAKISLTHGDISGIIGFAGKEISGSVAISLAEKTALYIHQQLLSEKVDHLSAGVRDTVGEIANIIAGGAKTIFAKTGKSFHISIPTVVVGKNHSISFSVENPMVVIPFTINEFPFSVDISMKIVQ